MLDSIQILRVNLVCKIKYNKYYRCFRLWTSKSVELFLSKYEKSYANDDEQNLRYQIFKNNYRKIEEHN